MKKILILATLVVVLVMGLRDLGQAKPYRSLSILNPNYTVEIPDDVILPDTSQFERAVPPRHHPQNPEITPASENRTFSTSRKEPGKGSS